MEKTYAGRGQNSTNETLEISDQLQAEAFLAGKISENYNVFNGERSEVMPSETFDAQAL